MDEKIVQKLVKFQVDYEKSLLSFKNKENDFALFEHECKSYFEPLVNEMLPVFKKLIKFDSKEKIENYTPYIIENWQESFIKEFKTDDVLGAQFLTKLSEDLIQDFNNLLLSYRKTNIKLQQHFLTQFYKNKSNSILIILKNNPELGIKTISKLRSPQLQFTLINRHEHIFRELSNFFMQSNREAVYKVLSVYCNYPLTVTVDKYFKQWLGEEYIHIKFCKVILGNYYEDIKKFMKQRNEII